VVDEVSGILKGMVWLAVAGNVANHSLLAAGEIALELALNQRSCGWFPTARLKRCCRSCRSSHDGPHIERRSLGTGLDMASS
jgi:hypothetical protein